LDVIGYMRAVSVFLDLLNRRLVTTQTPHQMTTIFFGS